jgi:hypothetical protein
MLRQNRPAALIQIRKINLAPARQSDRDATLSGIDTFDPYVRVKGLRWFTLCCGNAPPR